ncbi:MAG: SRPBCC domain-containing protein [Kofleriaceae bacterium]
MSLQITTPTDTTIVLTRSFKAPRRLVWEAMTTPDKMKRWMLPPPGMTLTVCEVEARLGGTLKLAWKTADADPVMTLHGEWTEFSPYERMVHTETMKSASGETVCYLVEAHELTEKDGVTQMRITQSYNSKADRDGALASGMDQGMEACYQQLDVVVAQ